MYYFSKRISILLCVIISFVRIGGMCSNNLLSRKFFFKYVLTEACARTLPGLSKNCLVYSHFLLQSQSEFGICIFLIHDLFCCIHFMHKNKKTLRRKPIHNCINFAKRKTEWAHFLFTHLQQRFAPYLHPFG